MKILILSDLHHEIWKHYAPKIYPAQSNPDIVILAGDIHSGTHAVDWAAKTFDGLPVLYVQGNHESYGRKIEDTLRDTASACLLTDNVHFLHCGEFIFNQVRFLGTTLWTDFKLFGDESRSEAMLRSEEVMADYQRIRLASAGYRKLRAADTARFHFEQRGWLEKKLNESFDGKTVVITHMLPSMLSVTPRFRNDLASAAYASNLDDLIVKADLWVHGHTHDSFDYHVGKCRVVCNPCGYIQRSGGAENYLFDPNFLVELGT